MIVLSVTALGCVCARRRARTGSLRSAFAALGDDADQRLRSSLATPLSYRRTLPQPRCMF